MTGLPTISWKLHWPHCWPGRGIMAGNQGRWQSSVSDLRRAVSLNPHSEHARHNLCLALAGMAADLSYRDPSAARSLTDEAFDLAEELSQADPQNTEYERLRDRLADERNSYQSGPGQYDTRAALEQILGDFDDVDEQEEKEDT